MFKLAPYLPHKLSNYVFSPLYKKVNTIENKTIFCTVDPALMVREINTIILLQIYHIWVIRRKLKVCCTDGTFDILVIIPRHQL